MPNARFARYVLRTTDVPSAEAFYHAVLGHHGDHVFPLHEQALARGARPHWLGHIDVSDPAGAATSLLAAGAQRLGEGPSGALVLRDPGGALVALGGVHTPSRAAVVQHVLRSRNADDVAQLYAGLFGWSLGARLDLGDRVNYRTFAWDAESQSVGVVGEITEGVHPQWLYFFGVDSLDDAISKVRALGGQVMEPLSLPDGRRCAVCDDPQGAAFGLIDAASSPRRS